MGSQYIQVAGSLVTHLFTIDSCMIYACTWWCTGSLAKLACFARLTAGFAMKWLGFRWKWTNIWNRVKSHENHVKITISPGATWYLSLPCATFRQVQKDLLCSWESWPLGTPDPVGNSWICCENGHNLWGRPSKCLWFMGVDQPWNIGAKHEKNTSQLLDELQV
jgi:hypothetical protein